jgi:hypothetical protein
VSVIIRMIAHRPRTDSIGKMETLSSLLPNRKATGQQLFARCLLAFCVVIIAGDISSAWTDDPRDSFAVQVIEPYPVSTVPGRSELTLDEDRILHLACQCSPVSNLMLSLARSQEAKGHKSEAEQKREAIVCLLANVAAHKTRSERAAGAMKAHFGLAASRLGGELVMRTEAELAQQTEIQIRLIEAGISIPDDSLLTRLQNETKDSKLELESKDRVLRIQLSGLIPNAYACSYEPVVKIELQPCDIDVCEYVEKALACHYELIALGKIRSLLGPESVETGKEILALVANVPVLPAGKASLLSRLKSVLDRTDRTLESDKQKSWLGTLIMERRREIAREIEVAYENKRTAALRWSLVKEQLNAWSRRVEQLEKLGEENRGTIAELGGAKLAKLKEEARLIERWLEWQMANVDLRLAMGECVCPE